MEASVVRITERQPPVAPLCKCTPRWVDEACIWSAIDAWKPSESLLCLGCWKNSPHRQEHECHGHLTGYMLPDVFPEAVYPEFEARTRYTLRDPKTVEALFKIYLDKHPNASELKEKMDWGIQRLMKTELWKVQDMFADKDRAAHRSQ